MRAVSLVMGLLVFYLEETTIVKAQALNMIIWFMLLASAVFLVFMASSYIFIRGSDDWLGLG